MGPRGILQIAAQKILERALADEADPGAVRLVEHPKSRRVGAVPHLVLAELADRKQGVRECLGRDAVQEIALILGRVASLEEPGAAGPLLEACVMAGGDALGAEAVHVIQAHAELDLPVAEHIRVGRSAGRVFAQETGEHTLAVLGGEAHPMQRDGQRFADGARILEVLGGGAIGIVVVIPVGHVESLNRESGLLQQERRDGRVDAARHADDDRLGGVRMRGGEGHPPIIIYRRGGCGA